jgi:hypothetical protein
MTPPETGPKDRNSERRRVLKAGTIAYSGRHVTLKCAIRDMSENGARLLVEGSVAAPDTFELLTEIDGMEAPCQVVWRRGMEVGVRFLAPPRYAERKRTQVLVQTKTTRPTLRRLPKLPA